MSQTAPSWAGEVRERDCATVSLMRVKEMLQRYLLYSVHELEQKFVAGGAGDGVGDDGCSCPGNP